MDPYSIFVNDLPKNLTCGEIKGAFWPFQTTPSLTILKKEKYLIITVESADTVQQILKEKDQILLKRKKVSIKRAHNMFKPTTIHLPPSFFLPIKVLMPPFFIPVPAPTAPAPTPT